MLEHLETHGGRISLPSVPVRRDGVAGRMLRRLRGGASGGGDRWRDHLAAQRAKPLPPLPASPRRRPVGDEPPRVAAGWRVRRLTDGTREGRFHSHNYYDIAVLDDTRTLVAAYEARIEDRWMTPEDAVTVGVVSLADGGFEPIADTTAGSRQQGPLAQWVPGRRQLVWNHREGETFVARLHDIGTGVTRSLARSVYALAPDGATALGLDMARLSRARPGYGYFGADTSRLDRGGAAALAPDDEGVWQLGLDAGSAGPRLLLPLAEAVAYLQRSCPTSRGPSSPARRTSIGSTTSSSPPTGSRFTVKLRWRVASLEQPWQGTDSVSLTAASDGSDLRLLWPPPRT